MLIGAPAELNCRQALGFTNPNNPHRRVLEKGGPGSSDARNISFYGTVLKIGDELRAGDQIGIVYCDGADRGQRAVARIQAAYEIGDAPPAELPRNGASHNRPVRNSSMRTRTSSP